MPAITQTMRVTAYSTGIGVTTALRRLTDLLAAPAPSLPDRYPDKPQRDMPDTVRVVEGELLRPAAAADSLLTLFQHSTISAQARRLETPAPPAEPFRSKPTSVQLYQLHSSNENLAADLIGRTLNQYA